MAFYQCDKCRRVWQHPLSGCPFCFEKLSEMKAKKAKVVASSKVSIPTILHPAVPYYVLLLEDENGNRWAQKSFEAKQIGQELNCVPSGGAESVALWPVKYDLRASIEKIFELLEIKELKPGTKTLLLCTLQKPSHSYFRDNTSPEFLEAVLAVLEEKGIESGDIQVAGQSFDERPIEASAQKSGLLGVCTNRKILPLDLAKGEFEKRGKFEISKNFLEADLVLNLAIMKMGQASAADNLCKILKKENYLGLKYLENEKEIISDLESALPQAVTLAEADSVQRPDKYTAFLGLMLGGKKASIVDRVFNEIVLCRQLPEVLKDITIDNINVVGRQIKEFQYPAGN